jgi:peptidyl-prolyl cis-trans isomerase B (cyclophilin B)
MTHLTRFILASCLLTLFSCGDNETTAVSTETSYPIAHVSTRLGDMYFWLYDETPVHKAKFIELAKANHYNQFTFNRVVKNFVVQGGCPDSVTYFENSPYLLDPEFHDSLGHSYGALGMGRDDNPGKQSNACQFYIVCKESGLPQLDSNYMIFGMIIKGLDVLESIEKENTNTNDEPVTKIPLDVSIDYLTEQVALDSLGFKLP